MLLTDPEYAQERDALDLAAMGIAAALKALPLVSTWHLTLEECHKALCDSISNHDIRLGDLDEGED